MKKLTKTITLICLFNLVIAGLVLAQTTRSSTTSTAVAPAPVVPSATSVGRTTTSTQRSPDQLVEAKQLDELLVRLGATSATASEAYISPVIPSGQISTEELLKINEDMNIMSQILGDNLRQTGINILTGIGYNINFVTSSRQKPIQAMFLQGYGALFMANVDFPLSAPPDVNDNKEQAAKDDTDRVWEQTRQQIYQPQTAEISRRFSTAGAGAAEVRYDAKKVEKLKTTLIQSLKHASNIRVLKADESMILSITGSGISTKIIAKIQMDDGKTVVRYEANGRQIERMYNRGEWPDLSLEQTAPTVLVIRVKKADIDAFAKNELNLEQFSQRVQIISYPLLGGKTNVATVLPTTTTGRTSRTTTTGPSGTTTGGRTTTGTTGTATRSRTTAPTLGTTSGGGTTTEGTTSISR